MPSVASKKRGLAADSVTPERRQEIASAGGKAAHAQGKGHQWDSKAARKAGRKGGSAPKGKR